MTPPPLPPQVLEAALALLAERHALGAPGSRLPGWVEARLAHALPGVARDLGCTLGEVPARLARDAARLAALAGELRVGETSFHRDPELWAALGAHWRQGAEHGPLAVLSAGCSTGEEAWTAAMVLAVATDGEGAVPRRANPPDGPAVATPGARSQGPAGQGPAGQGPAGQGPTSIGPASTGPARMGPGAGAMPFRVVGVDRSAEALGVAQVGRYPRTAARHLPPELARRFLLEAGDDSVEVSPALRDRVRFVERDLAQGPPAGRWDCVLLRNVLLYLDEVAGARVVERLVAALVPPGGGHDGRPAGGRPGGVLVVARAEVPRVRALGLLAVDLGGGVTGFAAPRA